MSLIDFGPSYVRNMPFYILVGCGPSMKGAPLAAIEQGIQLLYGEMLNSSIAVESLKMSIISFTEKADQIVPLTPIYHFSVPSLTSGTSQNLGSAFQLLGERLPKEMTLSSENQRGDYKAFVLILSDQTPSDDDVSQLEELKQNVGGLIGEIVFLACGDELNMTKVQEIFPQSSSMRNLTPDYARKLFKWESQPLYKNKA
jgi:uncharacterized protein YegL